MSHSHSHHCVESYLPHTLSLASQLHSNFDINCKFHLRYRNNYPLEKVNKNIKHENECSPSVGKLDLLNDIQILEIKLKLYVELDKGKL